MTSMESFKASLAESAPPAGLDLALQALWWAGRNKWDRAHALVQQREGELRCDRVHAYLHRQEGDLGNAGYWYRRAGQSFPSVSLEEEWAATTAQLLSP